ncbi:MAG TPA: GGDEF domain-containing response regulator [Solirubrobacteraceae bacterium]|nr:GGDEF domain-containing response regulator [Solirubrobacteraceae bacterium]
MPQELGAGKPARVLLVQDDPRATMMISEMLRAVWSAGLIISQAHSVADATQELLDHGATCVLLDLAGDPAPVASVQQLSGAAPHTPIIVLVERDDEDFGVEAVRSGAQDVLVKSELTAAALGRAARLAIERKRSEAALALQALHDPLTALPNRALFLDRLRVALDRSRRTGVPVVVMFLDVDGFKAINDTHGHSAGDLVLTVLAGRFGRLLRPMDTVARFGGDEFTFLFEGLESEQEAALVAQRISESARQPLAIGDSQMSIAVSIGVAIVGDPEAALEETVRRADTAMYRAKELGGARFELFGEPAIHTPVAGPDLEPALRQALDRCELRVHYQPRVSLAGHTGLVGFEALVRWDHPERGLMEPDQFMALAEDTGLIIPIGDWVLEQALDQVAQFRESRPEVTVSVNLSPRQLHDAGLLDRLTAAIRRGGHDPGVLCLEVPETAVAADPEVAARQLAALNELGIQLAIDDFGTGRASTRDLQRMPVHILKIDRTLVSRLQDGTADTDGIGAAVQLGHALGLCVVAEGVETDAQLAALRDLGCDGAQGYLFSRPMPEEGVHSLLGTR